MFDRINRRYSIRYKNTNVDGITNKLNSMDSKNRRDFMRRDFIKWGVMSVLGSLLPVPKGDTLIINTKGNVGMSMDNPNGILRITNSYGPIGIGCPHIPYEMEIRNV
jgi:hypothetical protein